MASFLPEDLIFFQILVRLPIKFLIRLTLICKRWHFLITNRKSIEFHIANASYNLHNSPSFLINWYTETIESGFTIVNKDQNNVLIKRINDSIATTCKQIFTLYDFYDSIPESAEFYMLEPHNFVSAIGSVNGLVCFYENVYYFIWNPMTKMFKAVSEPPRDLSEKLHGCNSRFCYDRFDRDFKIIEIVRYEKKSELGRVLFRVWVYSCNLDTWREVKIRDGTLPNLYFSIVEHVKDKLYVEFIPERVDSVIYRWEAKALVAFDIHNEIFERLPCPKHTIERAKYGRYINWKDSLGIVVDMEANDLGDPGAPFGSQDVYTFDEITGAWIHQYKAPEFLSCYRIFFGLENGDLVVDERLGVEVGNFKLLEAQSIQFRNLTKKIGICVDFMRYTESLVCINGMQQL